MVASNPDEESIRRQERRHIAHVIDVTSETTLQRTGDNCGKFYQYSPTEKHGLHVGTPDLKLALWFAFRVVARSLDGKFEIRLVAQCDLCAVLILELHVQRIDRLAKLAGDAINKIVERECCVDGQPCIMDGLERPKPKPNGEGE